MHISEGVLAPGVLIAGGVFTAAGVALGVKKLRQEDIPKASVLTSAFFVASFIHIPAGVASVHLVLNGVMGLFLGWAAFPCFLVALALQAVMFQFGGLTTLGVNTFNMAIPAILSYYLFRKMILNGNGTLQMIGGFLCGFSSVLGGTFLIGISLYFSGEGFLHAASIVAFSHIPVMIIEGIVTAMTLSFVCKVKPEMLEVNG
jgi:cobalt/nickel transport system permease protein